jgi:hypothetical protein
MNLPKSSLPFYIIFVISINGKTIKNKKMLIEQHKKTRAVCSLVLRIIMFSEK